MPYQCERVFSVLWSIQGDWYMYCTSYSYSMPSLLKAKNRRLKRENKRLSLGCMVHEGDMICCLTSGLYVHLYPDKEQCPAVDCDLFGLPNQLRTIELHKMSSLDLKSFIYAPINVMPHSPQVGPEGWGVYASCYTH